MLSDLGMFPDTPNHRPDLWIDGKPDTFNGYFAPELIMEGTPKYTKASDAYAFGSLILEVSIKLRDG